MCNQPGYFWLEQEGMLVYEIQTYKSHTVYNVIHTHTSLLGQYSTHKATILKNRLHNMWACTCNGNHFFYSKYTSTCTCTHRDPMGAARGGEEYRAAALLMAPIHCCMSVTSLCVYAYVYTCIYMYMYVQKCKYKLSCLGGRA